MHTTFIKYVVVYLLTGIFFFTPVRTEAQTGTQVKQTSEKTVETDIRTQKAIEAWLEEERRLLDQIDTAKRRLKHTARRIEKNAAYRETLKEKVKNLKERSAEMEKINQDLLWVLEEALERLRVNVDADSPFYESERRKRFVQAERILDDYDIGLLQKTRTVFDAVAGEVDAGYGVDVRDGEIETDGRLKQVKMLQAGNVGLFALTPDMRAAYRWDGGRKEWLALENGCRAIEEAIRMAEGTRIIGFSLLPLGRPVQQNDAGGATVE